MSDTSSPAEQEAAARDLAALRAMSDAAALARQIAAAGRPAPLAPVPDFGASVLRTRTKAVPPEWIDYNGHMNVSYYTMAFDKAADEIYDEVLLIGADYARRQRMGPYVLQQHIHYLGELLEGEEFCGAFRIIDRDAKRLHTWTDVIRVSDGRVAASAEAMVMNVDLELRRAAPYPDWAMARIDALAEAQKDLPRPARLGRPIGIRRG